MWGAYFTISMITYLHFLGELSSEIKCFEHFYRTCSRTHKLWSTECPKQMAGRTSLIKLTKQRFLIFKKHRYLLVSDSKQKSNIMALRNSVCFFILLSSCAVEQGRSGAFQNSFWSSITKVLNKIVSISLVIACVDSRECPANILGFQPGEKLLWFEMLRICLHLILVHGW